MSDNFALLNEPRRPWIDVDQLKQKFLALSTGIHPDRTHNAPTAERQAAAQRYSDLNAAYNCLREPKERLRHLLELELGETPVDIQRIPPGMMDAFFEVGRLCKETDAFLAEKAGVTSPLMKVKLFERGQEWTEKLMALQQTISARRNELLAELQGMNPAWESAPQTKSPHGNLPLKRLEEIYRLLSYFARWSEQLQERIVQLSF
ncbi:MAG: hscB [Pedosphaera sp.]|nr:hscB [Pedosphaera sp.]